MSETPRPENEKYEIARQFSEGFCAALYPAGWDAGYSVRREKNKRLNDYLESIGQEPMAMVRLCAPAETVKVRIAVAVDPTGQWSANGYSDKENPTWDRLMDVALDFLASGEARYWVEAELPVPTAPVVQGEVSEG